MGHFCGNCGNALVLKERFCTSCGHPANSNISSRQDRRTVQASIWPGLYLILLCPLLLFQIIPELEILNTLLGSQRIAPFFNIPGATQNLQIAVAVQGFRIAFRVAAMLVMLVCTVQYFQRPPTQVTILFFANTILFLGLFAEAVIWMLYVNAGGFFAITGLDVFVEAVLLLLSFTATLLLRGMGSVQEVPEASVYSNSTQLTYQNSTSEYTSTQQEAKKSTSPPAAEQQEATTRLSITKSIRPQPAFDTVLTEGTGAALRGSVGILLILVALIAAIWFMGWQRQSETVAKPVGIIEAAPRVSRIEEQLVSPAEDKWIAYKSRPKTDIEKALNLISAGAESGSPEQFWNSSIARQCEVRYFANGNAGQLLDRSQIDPAVALQQTYTGAVVAVEKGRTLIMFGYVPVRDFKVLQSVWREITSKCRRK